MLKKSAGDDTRKREISRSTVTDIEKGAGRDTTKVSRRYESYCGRIPGKEREETQHTESGKALEPTADRRSVRSGRRHKGATVSSCDRRRSC